MEELRRTRKSRWQPEAFLLTATVAMSLVACLIMLPAVVYASTNALNPNAEGTYQQWTLVGTTHYDATSDGLDNTYVYVTENTLLKETLNLQDPTFPDTATIDNVVVYVRAKADASGGVKKAVILIKTDGTDYESVAITVSKTNFTDYSNVWENNPKTGLPWTKAQVAALEAGIRASSLGAGDNIKCSEIWVVVNYTPFDFSVNVSPDNLSVQQASSVSTTVHVTLTQGTAGTVNLSGTWIGTAPGGVTGSFSPSSGSPNFDSTLTFSTTAAATVGNFTYRVFGKSGDQTRSTDVSLEITELILPAAPTLVSPENRVAVDTLTPTFDWADAAGATSYTLEVAADNNFSNIVCTKTVIDSNVTLSETEELSYGTHYYWRVRGTNAAGLGDWSLTWGFTAKLTAPKVLSFEIEAGSQYTNSTSVELTISARNAAEMQFSSDGVIWGGWEPYTTSKSYTLAAGEGTKNVYIKVRDIVGDIGEPSVSSIILDRTPPSTTHSLSGDLDANGYKGSVVVMLTSTDAYGVESTRYRIDVGEWQTGHTFVISSEGEHTIGYHSTDAAGNEEEIKSFQVTVYTPTTFPLILLVGILSIIAAAVVVTSLRLKPPSPKKRLKMVMEEKKEALRLKKEAAVKYFKNGSISRGTYDELMGKYDSRMAELEEKERVLRARMNKKVKKKVKKRKKKPGEATERLQSIKKRIGRV